MKHSIVISMMVMIRSSVHDVGDDPYLPMLIDQYIFLEGYRIRGLLQTVRLISKLKRLNYGINISWISRH